MRGTVCVVAGSTSGVGLQAIRRFARAGADVVMVCRNRAKAEPIRDDLARAHGVRADIVVADFRDLPSVRTAAGVLLEKYPRIDVLVNSAGIHSTLTTTPSGMETVFCVNHLASFLLTHLLLELYYLAAAPEMAGVSGRFFHLTIEEKPAAHALDRALGRRAWDASLALAGLDPEVSRGL